MHQHRADPGPIPMRWNGSRIVSLREPSGMTGIGKCTRLHAQHSKLLQQPVDVVQLLLRAAAFGGAAAEFFQDVPGALHL
jgi:hypothetical protein